MLWGYGGRKSLVPLTLALPSQFALGFKAVHLSGVELKHMGQQLVGQYPIHFHLAGDVDKRGGYDPPTYIKDLSIHHTFSRCVTVHGSNGLLVSAHSGKGEACRAQAAERPPPRAGHWPAKRESGLIYKLESQNGIYKWFVSLTTCLKNLWVCFPSFKNGDSVEG